MNTHVDPTILASISHWTPKPRRQEQPELEEGTCSNCSGSGEGLWDGGTCTVCHGSGVQMYEVETNEGEEE